MNLSTLLKDLIFLYIVHILYLIKKWWPAALPLIAIMLAYLINVGSVPLIFSNLDSNISENLSISLKEIETQYTNVITNHWFSSGIIFGGFIFIAIMSIVSLINSLSLINKYSKSENMDNESLFNLIDALYKGEQINFINSNDSTKILLLHLYNLKISKYKLFALK